MPNLSGTLTLTQKYTENRKPAVKHMKLAHWVQNVNPKRIRGHPWVIGLIKGGAIIFAFKRLILFVHENSKVHCKVFSLWNPFSKNVCGCKTETIAF